MGVQQRNRRLGPPFGEPEGKREELLLAEIERVAPVETRPQVAVSIRRRAVTVGADRRDQGLGEASRNRLSSMARDAPARLASSAPFDR